MEYIISALLCILGNLILLFFARLYSLTGNITVMDEFYGMQRTYFRFTNPLSFWCKVVFFYLWSLIFASAALILFITAGRMDLKNIFLPILCFSAGFGLFLYARKCFQNEVIVTVSDYWRWPHRITKLNDPIGFRTFVLCLYAWSIICTATSIVLLIRGLHKGV